MLFNSIQFMVFFPIVVLIFYIIPQKIRYIWLLLCSYFFYMSWNLEYVLLIMFSTIMTYLGSVAIEVANKKEKSVGLKKGVLIITIIVNLLILIYFKYSGILLELCICICSLLGINLSVPVFDIILPVGISFYTFQAIGYTIDVYRGDVKCEKNILKYALFVSFFPQLVAGPIERSKRLLGQINSCQNTKFCVKKARHGLFVMLWGFFLKMVIADRVCVLVNEVFENYYVYGGIELIIGAVAFAIQIYCDFSSYSIIAVGAAEVLGYSLMENFNAPYFAMSVKEFWKRWHISLSSWFRDYLYIPLGGNRCSKNRKRCNLMITFLVSGLWHGASLNYVVWGGCHGAYQIVAEYVAPYREKLEQLFGINPDCFSYKFGRVLGTFILTDIAWVFFRADGVLSALSYIYRMFMDIDPWVLFSGTLYEFGIDRFEMNILFFALILLFLADYMKYKKNVFVVDFILNQNVIFQTMAMGFIFVYIFIFGAYGSAFDPQAFIYFQF